MVFVEHSFIMGLDDDVEHLLHNIEIRSNCLFQITNIASCQVDKYHIDFIPVNRVTLTNTIYNDIYIATISLRSKAIFHICFVAILNWKWVSNGVWFSRLVTRKDIQNFLPIRQTKTYQALNYWLVKYLSAFILLNLVKYRILDVTFKFIS